MNISAKRCSALSAESSKGPFVCSAFSAIQQAVPDRFRNARRNAHQVLVAARREGGLDQFAVANGQPDC